MRVLWASALTGLLVCACDAPAPSSYLPYVCESVQGQAAQAAEVLRVTSQSYTELLAEMSGTYQVWWSPPDGAGEVCDVVAPLCLQLLPVVDMELVTCQQQPRGVRRTQLSPKLLDEVRFLARCALEGFADAPCWISRTVPATWYESGTLLTVEFVEGGDLSAFWRGDGVLFTSSIRGPRYNELLGTVCSAPRRLTPTPYPPGG